MNINWSQFYVGTEKIEREEFKSWKGGKEYTRERNNDVQLPKYDKTVVYDFGLTPEGDSITFEDLKELRMEENTILEIRNGKAIREIMKQRIGNKFAEDADQREWVINHKMSAATRISPEIRAMTEEERVQFYYDHLPYRNDSDNVLNHSFVNNGFDLDKLFQKASIGYAKYLNQEVESEYDDEIYIGFENEKKYRSVVKDELKEAVARMMNYFMMGTESQEDIDRVSGELADGVIKYAHQVAKGDRNIENLDAKLTINGVELQYKDLLQIQSTLYELNRQGTGDNEFEYDALSKNYDTITGLEKLGQKTYQVRRMCQNQLPDEVGKMVLETYEKRTDNTIKKYHTSMMLHFYNEINISIKEKLKRTGNYSNTGLEEYMKYYQYEGSEFEQAYKKYAEKPI